MKITRDGVTSWTLKLDPITASTPELVLREMLRQSEELARVFDAEVELEAWRQRQAVKAEEALRTELAEARAEVKAIKFGGSGGGADRIERVFKACGYTKVEGDRDLLTAILAAVEGIRADLQRARDARRV